MATVVRGLIQRGDLALYDGRSTDATRTDATGGTLTGVVVGDAVDVLQVYGAGTSRTRGSLAAAIAAIGSGSATLSFAPGTWVIDTSITVPSNLAAIIPAGCVFSVSSGQTLTFSGPVYRESTTYKTGAGSVVFSANAISDFGRTSAEVTAGHTPTAYEYPPGELLRIGQGVAGYVRSWTQRRVYNVAEFAGAEFGAKLQACYDYALAEAQAGDGLGEGIAIMVPPNPDGGWWEQSTAVDLSGGGYVHLFGVGTPYIRATANLAYHIRVGVTNKADRVTIEGIEFSCGNFTVTQAILGGGGTRWRVSDIGFQRSGGETGSYTNGIYLDRSLDPNNSGVTYSMFENIHDTGGGAVSNAMIYADGLVSSVIRHVRVAADATYGVYLISGDGVIQGNVVEAIHAATSSTTTALVYLNATSNAIAYNTIRALNGQGQVDYGVQMTGAGSISSNTFDVLDTGYTSAPVDVGSNATRWKNVVQALEGSATWDPADLAASSRASTTVTVTGAVLGDYVEAVSFSANQAQLTLHAWVSGNDTVSVDLMHIDNLGGNVNLASGTLRVRVRKA